MIGDIDALIDAALAVGPVDDYDADRYVKCELCGHDWHGTPAAPFVGVRKCPGAWADDDAKAAYLRRPAPTRYVDQVQGVRLSTTTPFQPDGMVDDRALAAAGFHDLATSRSVRPAAATPWPN